jgi:hypothetical protein
MGVFKSGCPDGRWGGDVDVEHGFFEELKWVVRRAGAADAIVY